MNRINGEDEENAVDSIMEKAFLDDTTADEAAAGKAHETSLSAADVTLLVGREAAPETRFTNEAEALGSSPASSAGSGLRLSLAPEKKSASSEPISTAEPPLVEREAPVLPQRHPKARAPAQYSMPRMPVEYRVEACGGSNSGCRLSQVCFGVCAVSLFVISALITGTLTVHAVRRVDLVSRLLREIVNETRLHSPDVSAPATITTPPSSPGKGNVVVDKLITAGRPVVSDDLPTNGTQESPRPRLL